MDAKTRDQNRFIVRMPEGMRDRIRDAAEANNRSMNAEIIATLERNYPGGDGQKILTGVVILDLIREMEQMKDRLEQLGDAIGFDALENAAVENARNKKS